MGSNKNYAVILLLTIAILLGFVANHNSKFIYNFFTKKNPVHISQQDIEKFKKIEKAFSWTKIKKYPSFGYFEIKNASNDLFIVETTTNNKMFLDLKSRTFLQKFKIKRNETAFYVFSNPNEIIVFAEITHKHGVSVFFLNESKKINETKLNFALSVLRKIIFLLNK